MKITFTFDNDEQRQLALNYIPTLPDSNDIDVGERFIRQVFLLLRRFVNREEILADRLKRASS